MISAVDLLPTFCELGEAQLPEDYRPDGISQVATLLGKPTATRSTPLFWKMQSPWAARYKQPCHWVSYAVVVDHWKLVGNNAGSYCELFDLRADPFEKQDVSASQPVVVKEMESLLADWKMTLPAKPVGNVFSAERKGF